MESIVKLLKKNIKKDQYTFICLNDAPDIDKGIMSKPTTTYSSPARPHGNGGGNNNQSSRGGAPSHPTRDLM